MDFSPLAEPSSDNSLPGDTGAVTFRSGDDLATTILETAGVLVIVLDGQGRIVLFNRACRQLTGYKFEEVAGRVFWNFLVAAEEQEAVQSSFANLRAGHFPNSHENDWIAKNGMRYRIAWHNTALLDTEGEPQWIIGTGLNVTQKRVDAALAAAQARLLELIATGALLADVLHDIVRLIEEQTPDAIASIVMLDEDGVHIRQGAGPNLPNEYWNSIEGMAIGPEVGSCGTAIYCKEPVIVRDIATDPLWANYRNLVLPYNLRACWSSPIIARDGQALGAFAIYYHELRRPREEELKLIRVATHLAGVAIEKERSEKQLRESQKRFLNMASNVPGMVHQLIVHSDGRLEWPFISEGCREFYNCSPQEIQENPYLPIDVLHPEDRPGFDEALEDSMQSLAPLLWEGRYFKQPGEIRWLKTVARPHRLKDDSTLWDGVVVDITERRQAEEALQSAQQQLEATVIARTQELSRSNEKLQEELLEHQITSQALLFSEAQFRSIVQTAIDGVILADSQGVITEWNRGAEAIFGYTRDEIIGQQLEVLVPHRHRQAHQAGLRRASEGDKSNSSGRIIEIEGIRRDGTEVPIELSLNSWRAGDQIFYSGIARDITERKRLLNRLQEEVEQSRRLQGHLLLQFERMPIACIVWDAQMRVQSWNPAAERIFGYTAQEALQINGYDLLSYPEQRTELQEVVGQVFQGNETIYRTNENLTKDGRIIVCSWSNTTLRDSSGQVTGMLSMAQDITERYHYENALQQAKEEAERANAAKSEYLSRMSHELRTPLNAIIGFSQILETENLDAEQQESVAHILRAGKHLLGLVNHVLDISRFESDHLQ